jgi:protein-disulfide isomerase
MATTELSLAAFLSIALLGCSGEERRNSPSTAPPSAPAGAPAAAPIAPTRTSDAPPAIKVPIDGFASFGAECALVTMVVFNDYECPYCARLEKTLAVLRADYGAKLRVVVVPRPLPVHEHARASALAFLAAAELGRGEAMYERLHEQRNALEDSDLVGAARSLGLDVAAFDTARNGSQAAATLERAERLARSVGAKGTPTTFVNGRKITGAQPIETFRILVDEELARAERLVASGVAPTRVYETILATAAEPRPAAEEDDGTGDPVDVKSDDAPFRGGTRAPVTVVVFSDFDCHFCAGLEQTLATLVGIYGADLKVAFRNRPLPMHDEARLAAKAAIAAEKQGAFWPYHDLLFASRGAHDRASLERYATTLGLDRARFARDLDAVETEQRLAADEKQADALHVEGTPTLFVNGRRIVGNQPLPTIRAAIERSLPGKR